MPNAFNFFKTFIGELKETPFYEMSQAEYNNKINKIQRMAGRAEEEIIEATCEHTDASQTTMYVKNRRQAIIVWIHYAMKCLPEEAVETIYSNEGTPSIINLWKTIYVRLEGIKYFLEEHYGTYLKEPDTPATAAGLHKADIDCEDQDKVQMNMSMPQIGFLLRLLVDMLILKPKANTILFRIVTRNFKTAKQEQMSEESLYKKFRYPDRVAVLATLDLLFALINHIKKNFM